MSWRMVAGGPKLAIRVEKHDNDCSLHFTDTFLPNQFYRVTIVELEKMNPSLLAEQHANLHYLHRKIPSAVPGVVMSACFLLFPHLRRSTPQVSLIRSS